MMAHRRKSAVVAMVYFAAVVAALISALITLSRDADGSGLQYMFQLPLALPWALVPIGIFVDNQYFTAYWYAGLGVLNAVLLYHFLERRRMPDK